MSGDSKISRFEPLFQGWASRVRRRLALRHALSGAAIGLAIGLVPAAVAWKTRHGALRPFAAASGLVGLAAGIGMARRKRWSDDDVALYLDGELDSEEAISTAVELARGADDEVEDDTRAVVLESAASALGKVGKKEARPTWAKPVHLLLPLAAAGIVVIARAPLPAAPLVVAAPGTTQVQLSQVDGLEKVAKLAEMNARDDAQKERLEKIARDAEKLKEDLNKGIEQREAQDRIAKLKESIAAERLSLGTGEKRQGLESAVSKLNETDATKDAAKALGDHDLESMDAEMERVANEREKADRELAKKAIEDAASEARKNGAPDVAKALDDEKKAMDAREKRASALRDLSDAMKSEGIKDQGVQQGAEALDQKGSDDAAQKLADAMGKALEKMTPEEKKRLAEKLKEMSKQQGGSGGAQSDPQDLKDLAKELDSAEGQKELEDKLKDMAKEDDESAEAKRQKELDDAQNGADDAQKDVDKHGRNCEAITRKWGD